MMETTYDQSVSQALKKAAGKEFSDMTDDDFKKLMDGQSKEDLLQIREYLMRTRDFYKRVILEEYRSKHPNSYRYKNAEEAITKLNNKGKILKEITDSK